jgi:hypothetical protein
LASPDDSAAARTKKEQQLRASLFADGLNRLTAKPNQAAGPRMHIITIIPHSDGKYRVYKDLGGCPEEVGDRVDNEFETPGKARAYAKTLQEKLGGPDRVKISDLTRRP